MFSTDFIFRQQENPVDNQKCQAGFSPLCNKILLSFRSWLICQINAIYRNKNSKLLTSKFSDFWKWKIAHFSCFSFQNSGHIAKRARPSHLFLKKLPKLHFKTLHEIWNIFGPNAKVLRDNSPLGTLFIKCSWTRVSIQLTLSWTHVFSAFAS